MSSPPFPVSCCRSLTTAPKLHAPQERRVGEVYDNVPVETLQALKQLGLRGEVHLTASVVSEDLSM
jgi:hypothetical protein